MIGTLGLLGTFLTSGAPEQATDGGIAAAREALTLTVVDSLILQSDVDWHRGDYYRASKASLVGAILDPTFSDGMVNAAWLTWSWGAKDLALRILDELARTNADNSAALHEAAVQAEMQGDRKRAIAWESQAHALEPEDALIGITLAGFYRDEERWEEAAAVYRDVLQWHPGHPSATRYLERYEVHGHMRAEPQPTSDQPQEGHTEH